jgi:hypothetical protein
MMRLVIVLLVSMLTVMACGFSSLSSFAAGFVQELRP